MQFIHPRSLFFLILVFSTVVTGIRREPNHKKWVKIASTIIVNPNGQGNFNTIQAAIDSIPFGNINWVQIQIAPGIYTYVYSHYILLHQLMHLFIYYCSSDLLCPNA